MSGALPIIRAGQQFPHRRSIKVVIFGKIGAGKTSLLPTLPLDMMLFSDLEDGSPKPEVRS